MEKPILLPERLLRSTNVSLLDLKFHVGIRNLRDMRDEEDKGQKKHKDRDPEVHPLYIFEGGNTVASIFETARCQKSRLSETLIKAFKLVHKMAQLCREGNTHKTYEPSTGPMTVPIALKAWAKLMRSSEYRGGPQTERYGFAAVSRDPSPLPHMKVAPQNPPNER